MKSIRVFVWASFAIGAVLSVHSEDYFSAIPVAVNRRSSIDIYLKLQGNKTLHGQCNVNNATYLVEDNQCVDNQYLFNGNKKNV